MKFNYKKIASVLASTVMLSSTVAVAAAAGYAPFINNGVADSVVIYGEKAALSDQQAASDIKTTLGSGLLTQAVSGSTVSTTSITGETKAIETSGQKLYLGDYMNNTKEAFTKSDLPTVLADGKVTEEGTGTSYDYNLKIKVPNTIVKFGKTSDNLATPVLYVDTESSSQYYDTEVIFPTAVNVTKLTNKDINLFGKKYTFSGSTSDLTTTSIVMFENSQSVTIASGETKPVSVSGTSYDVGVTLVESGTEATITVNGVSQKVTEGSSYKVEGLDVYIKNVLGASIAGEYRGVELYVGSAKLTLSNSNDVTLGATTLYGARATITTSSNKVSKIAIRVTPYSLDNRTKYLKIADSFTDPVFKTFKMSFASISPSLEDAAKDQVIIKSSAEQKGHISFSNKAGGSYDLDLFMPSAVAVTTSGVGNASSVNHALDDTTTYPENGTKLGVDNTYQVVADTTSQIHENDYFITRNNEYSQIFRVDRIDVANAKVKVRDQASGSTSQEMSLNASSIGSVASLSLADGSTATITLTDNQTSSLNITCNKGDSVLYTKKGAKIDLTALRDTALYNQTAGRIVITEETSYNDGDFKKNNAATLGSTVNVTLLFKRATKTGNDLYVSSVAAGDGYSGTVGDYDVQYLTKYGTYIKQTGNDDKTATIFYPGTAASLQVLIGEEAAVITTTTSTTETGAAVGIPAILDKDAAIQGAGKNWIVVGGSCINTVAATLLGSSMPVCGADFTTKTGVGAGSFLIKTFAQSSGKVATLVAGYNAADTTNAATYFRNNVNSLSIADGKAYKGSTATKADLVIA